MTQRIATDPAFNDRPFDGEGVSVYAAGAESFRYRELRALAMDNGRGRCGWIKGQGGRHDIAATSVLKTARVDSAADPTSSIVYNLPADLAGVAINGVTTGVAGAASFQVSGDITDWLTVGENNLLVHSSTGNDGFYTIRATPSFAGGNTTIPVEEPIGDGTVDGEIARRAIFDVRKYLDDWENLSNQYRMQTRYLDSNRDDVSVILGTAALLDVEARAGGICRLRFVFAPETRAGSQPDTFRAICTSGPTSPADQTISVTPLRRTVLSIDTPALTDAGAYVYTIQAEVGSVTKELLTLIAVTPDASGPGAPTEIGTEAW